LRSIYPGKTRRSSATLGIADPTTRVHKRPVICFDNIPIFSDRQKNEQGTLTGRRTQKETAVLAEIFSYSSGSILYNCLSGCMFCVLLFNFVNYVLLLLCILTVVYSYRYACSFLCFLFNCVVLCIVLCVNVYCTAATG
jgi:hypothetical protein